MVSPLLYLVVQLILVHVGAVKRLLGQEDALAASLTHPPSDVGRDLVHPTLRVTGGGDGGDSMSAQVAPSGELDRELDRIYVIGLGLLQRVHAVVQNHVTYNTHLRKVAVEGGRLEGLRWGYMDDPWCSHRAGTPKGSWSNSE